MYEKEKEKSIFKSSMSSWNRLIFECDQATKKKHRNCVTKQKHF